MPNEEIKLNIQTIKLPLNGLSSIVDYYTPYGEDQISVIPIVIYNVEQLATEIAKHLKGCASNGCESDNTCE